MSTHFQSEGVDLGTIFLEIIQKATLAEAKAGTVTGKYLTPYTARIAADTIMRAVTVAPIVLGSGSSWVATCSVAFIGICGGGGGGGGNNNNAGSGGTSWFKNPAGTVLLQGTGGVRGSESAEEYWGYWQGVAGTGSGAAATEYTVPLGGQNIYRTGVFPNGYNGVAYGHGGRGQRPRPGGYVIGPTGITGYYQYDQWGGAGGSASGVVALSKGSTYTYAIGGGGNGASGAGYGGQGILVIIPIVS